MNQKKKSDVFVLAMILGALACSGENETGKTVAQDPAPATTTVATPDQDPSPPPELVAEMLAPFHGDFEAMVKRRLVRVLVVYNRTNFFLDGGTERGLTADSLAQFQKYLNSQLKLGRRPLTVAAIPVVRDQLIPYLLQGRGDIAAALLTITSEREQEVPFSAPVAQNVRELVVTGPSSPEIDNLDDLAGVKVVVRQSSSYWESLAKLNASFRDR
ncbi:MAG: transporter substrate-binding domain-containing protein, partial [Acidobacteriota bacterium]